MHPMIRWPVVAFFRIANRKKRRFDEQCKQDQRCFKKVLRNFPYPSLLAQKYPAQTSSNKIFNHFHCIRPAWSTKLPRSPRIAAPLGMIVGGKLPTWWNWCSKCIKRSCFEFFFLFFFEFFLALHVFFQKCKVRGSSFGWYFSQVKNMTIFNPSIL